MPLTPNPGALTQQPVCTSSGAVIVSSWRMTEALEIRLLGPFEAVVDGRQAHVTGSKQEALLAALALDVGRVVTVDTLVDALWGAELPTAPRNALQQHVVRLRTALGHGSIAATAEGYVLAEAAVDALEFEALVTQARAALRDHDARTAADLLDRAVALWRGTALQGLPDSTWATAESRRLETLRVDALEEQFEAALALGEHLELMARIPQALADSPYRERLWGQLMVALYRSGRQADALETFQEARRVLSDELGLDPGPELQRLRSLRTTRQSPPCPSSSGAAATCPRPSRPSSTANATSPTCLRCSRAAGS